MTRIKKLLVFGVAAMCAAIVFAQDNLDKLVRDLERGTKKEIGAEEPMPEPPLITNLTGVVGGLPVECLVMEKKGAPALIVKFDEIVLSSNRVTVAGTFTGSAKRKLTINPVSFRAALAGTIFSSAYTDRLFRFVADDEFRLVDYLPIDRIFGSSMLIAGGDWPVKFRYTYEGFPSDDNIKRSKSHWEKKSILSRFHKENNVRYFMRGCVGVRFWDQDYGYPKADTSDVNVNGEGYCVLKVE